MSLNDALPNKSFSLLYLATHVFDVSRSSATAAGTFGSFLSNAMVVLTLLITSAVSFTYSSSEEANAGLVGDNGPSEIDRTAAPPIDKISRRRGGGCLAPLLTDGAGAAVESLDLTGGRGAGWAVGVISAGDAMSEFVRERKEQKVETLRQSPRKEEEGNWVCATWAYHLILVLSLMDQTIPNHMLDICVSVFFFLISMCVCLYCHCGKGKGFFLFGGYYQISREPSLV